MMPDIEAPEAFAAALRLLLLLKRSSIGFF